MKFENDVKMYGTQAQRCLYRTANQFENDVKMYGTQATAEGEALDALFENDVKMYGTQASHGSASHEFSLRMM